MLRILRLPFSPKRGRFEEKRTLGLANPEKIRNGKAEGQASTSVRADPPAVPVREDDTSISPQAGILAQDAHVGHVFPSIKGQ